MRKSESIGREWDDASECWVDFVRRGKDYFRYELNNPAFFGLIGEVKGKAILDLACGEGYNTRILAKKGGKIIGIDTSRKIIKFAREEEERVKLNIRYYVMDACYMDKFPEREIYPEDKFLIVKGLQSWGHVIGMTGDGINDAPALRQAEVGIAVGNATDVAKRASSAVLTTEGLGGIVDLVKVGRTTFQRIATWIINKMIRTFKRVIFIVLAFIFTGQYVISAFDMILLLFLSDYVTLSLSTDNVRHSRKPESWDVTGLVKTGALMGILMVVESFVLLYIGLSYYGLYSDIDQLHTFVFDWLTFSGYFTVLAVRERRHFWNSRPNRFLTLSIAANMILVSLISAFGIPGLAPISVTKILTVIAYSFTTCLLLNDLIKAFMVRRFGMAL